MNKLLTAAVAAAAVIAVAVPNAAEARPRNNGGAALAAGIFGLAAGALIAGAIAEGNRNQAYAHPGYAHPGYGGPVYQQAPQYYAPQAYVHPGYVQQGFAQDYDYEQPVVVHRRRAVRNVDVSDAARDVYAFRNQRCQLVQVQQVDQFTGDVFLRTRRICN